ncbi:MAG: response regulator transcription factor [Elusimicrobia bacterium]|nr:response regulator transcription factor [Elusimicrobiota bacterium]
MTPPPVVALVGFEAAQAAPCRQALESQGFAVVDEPDVDSALLGIETRRSDLSRPDLFAFGPLVPIPCLEALRRVRAHPLTKTSSILVVNERLGIENAAAILDAGADDVYRKPFLPAIFSARVRALVRRRAEGRAADEDPNLLRLGPGLEVHLLQRTVSVDRLRVPLSRGQFDLLVALLRNRGNPVPGAELIALLAKSLLYVNAAHIKRELEQLRVKLLRFGACLQPQADGAYLFAEPRSS